MKMGKDNPTEGADGLPIRNHPSIQKFFKSRDDLIAKEKEQRSDYEFRQSLSPIAQQACDIVSRMRTHEHSTIWTSSQDGLEIFPGMMFNAAKPYMESTQLWKICQRMPKGSLLHCHLGAMVDLAWVIETAIETEGVCIFSEVPLDGNEAREQKDLKVMFSKQGKDGLPSIWSKDYIPLSHVPLKTAVDSFPEGGRAGFVKWLKLRCSITLSDSINHHLGINEVWRKMQTAFRTIVPMIFYAPILRKFIRKFLETLVEDRVFWVEMRGMSPNLRLDQEEELANAPLELVRILDEEINEFKKSEKGKDFWGARLIWDSLRTKSTGDLVQDMKNCIQGKKLYKDVVCGYDLVGPEDDGRTLHDLTPELIWFQEECAREGVEIPFFFHAGECLGDGDETDQNLFDAILLGTRRIGHGFSLYKHPLLIDMVKEKQILVESCPISNEMLRYTASIMSHPLPALLSRGVASSLSNDDPAIMGQGTSGMTHDFWQALQGWDNLGLAGLGSLAQNSVRWSVFEDQTDEKWLEDISRSQKGTTSTRSKRIQEWNEEWEIFCQWIVDEFGESIST